ncbi:MAG: hypothetical protein ACE15C_18260 [Phycisphaerae bacterium]
MPVSINPKDARTRIVSNFNSPADIPLLGFAPGLRLPLRIRVKHAVRQALVKVPPVYVPVKWVYQRTLKRLGL